ncbi:MAG TPA: tetratricopeptide repeat protein, partial [Candidatus Sulfotelmatobacter sp.]|nr:tetratricopeptide repeat protein [Candidatus Sulfotelmatobacter sp.]
AALNLGVALQESGELEAALDAYGQALRLRPESFGRIAQALVAAPAGTLFLDLGRLRGELLRRA